MAFKRKSPFSRTEVAEIVKRFLKPENDQPKVETIFFYKLYKEYPYEKFWRVYELDFKLNSLAWLLSEEGQIKLKTDMAVFNLDMPAQTEYTLQENKIGPDLEIKKSNKTLSQLFKK